MCDIVNCNLRHIVGTYKGTLLGLSSDSHQNMFFPGKSSFQVFLNDGGILRSFGCEEGVVSMESVCVAVQYVYDRSHGVHKMVMFATEGDCLLNW